MDRQKAINVKKKNRGQAPPPGDFIALGKTAPTERPEIKRPASPQTVVRKPVPAKRDSSSVPLGGSGLAAKKPKVVSQTFTPLGRPLGDVEKKSSPAPSLPLPYEEVAIDVEPSDILRKVLDAEEDGDDDKVEGLLCGAVKHLRANRSKPDQTVFLTLMYLAKTRPTVLQSETVIEAFCSTLKRDLALNFKAKGNPLVSVFACNVLMSAFSEEENWPDNFVKMYIDDSLGERVWVDREDCKGFVENIQTAFRTKASPRCLLVGGLEPAPGGGSPVQGLTEEDEGSKSSDGGDSERSSSSSIPGADLATYPRYPNQQNSIQASVLEVVREQLARRQAMDASCRNLIRLMTATSGYGEIRSMAVQRIEMWLQNPKLTRTAQDLLLAVCTNCTQEDSVDLEVISQLLKIRLKTKPLVSHYLVCMRELLAQHTDNIRILLTHTIYNELSNARNPNNMALVGIAFSYASEAASKILAEVFQDLLANKDDYLRALRGLLREIVRATRYDISFPIFCLGLMQERQEARFTEMEPAFKERFVMSIADLIPLSMLLSITPPVKEVATRADHKDLEVLQKFKQQLAVIERDAIWWMHVVVPKIMEIKPAEYVHCLRKVLFMESPEHYYNKDNWPPETDRNFYLRLVCEAPVLEDTLMRIMVIGLSRDLPLSSADGVDMVDQLIRRAAKLYAEGFQVLHVEKLEIIDALLNLCAYRYPENIVLPKGYTPPTLAISTLYWKAWLLLLIITAFNPSTFGVVSWEKYPILRCLMEMVMTNNYSFPPPTTATDKKMMEDIRSSERQLAQQEMQLVLEFESHLAAATSKVTITQQNSLLLDQLTTMDPSGVVRCPPQKVLEQLEVLNSSFKIGQMLCRSRSPDFLLDIIQRQGTSQSMPWLAELVEASEGSLDMLPVQCLCEFLLHDPHQVSTPETSDDDGCKAERQRRKQRIRKHRQLLTQLQDLVHGSSDNLGTMFDVFGYFLQRLASNQASARQQAIKGLSMLMRPPVSDKQESDCETAMDIDEEKPSKQNHDWLLKHLPSLPVFHHIKPHMCNAIRQACQVEMDPSLVSSYIIFLSKHALVEFLDDLALDISQLIVERTSVMNHILPDSSTEPGSEQYQTLEAFLQLYHYYTMKVRRLEKVEYSWSNIQDQIILQWRSGESATMHILVVHAIVIILTYDPLPGAEAAAMYKFLLDVWFPVEDHMPKAFLMDTSEEALLLPDWLKLRMIRSSEPRLVTAALQELDPRQLILFVQSFGIPVSSMSCLLKCLDNTAESDPNALHHVVTDPAYIAKLIHIQHLRGVTTGEKFYSLLTEGGTIPDDCLSVKDPNEVVQGPALWHVMHRQKVETSSQTALAKDLAKIFNPGTKSQEVPQLFQNLLKTVLADPDKASAVVQVITKKLESAQGQEFAKQLLTNQARSCPLIKLLQSKMEKSDKMLRQMLSSILEAAGSDQQSPLTTIISQYLEKNKPDKPVSREQQASLDLDLMKSHGKVSPENFISCLQATSDKDRLEPLVKQYMQEAIHQHRTSEGITVACTMLLSNKKENLAQQASVPLFTDWLELLDPEIVNFNINLQEQLVFGKDKKAGPLQEGSPEKRRSNPYLLALLIHQSQWATVQRCLSRVLRKDKLSDLDPSSVLDFVSACCHIPKIWQGRERKRVKDAKEDILNLNTEQLLALVDFLVLESCQSPEGNYKGETETGLDVQTERYAVDQGSFGHSGQQCFETSNRLDLLLSCICDDDNRIRTIVRHIQNQAALSTRSLEKAYQELFQELYLHFPYIISWLPPNNALTSEWLVSDKVHSQLDTITHRLITVLGKAAPGKATENRMYDANIACRKLAAKHPALFLRQLPMLAAVLGGRTQLSLGEMKNRNLLLLFTHVLGLLELLQPQIFHQQHTALASILEAYFMLFKAHGCETRQLGSMVAKFVMFLQNFVTHDPQRASSMLQQYVKLLSDLSMEYPEMPDLKSLLTGLTLPRQNNTDEAQVVPKIEESGTLPSKAQSGFTLAYLQPFLARIKSESSTDDLLEVLGDLDETSKRKVAVLEYFESDLKRLTTHVNDRCRNTAFSLIMRYIHHSPRKAHSFLSCFLNCLAHENPDIATSALRNLPEFTVLCQDEAQTLLQEAFNVGVVSSIDTSSYINDTLQLLNLETVLSSTSS
ncbi:integrator complex subunit 1-like isoform X2 [Pomacea canaliculata]|uniref:integrator complex subunit 1-like isoform X2 n=1 Tax=Pomacea canaliculata TaxID=400727 RepID=UPI000D7312DD|nr:integrator complex subunit 1-like isoform X2 [Pomacea canaliculata]